MACGRKTGGRQSGTPNRSTAGARQAIALLLDENASKLTQWLDTVAAGIRKIDPETGKQTDEFVIKPNPAKAFDMVQSLLEFHVPKLTRVQVAGVAQDSEQKNENTLAFQNFIDAIRQERQINAYGPDARQRSSQ